MANVYAVANGNWSAGATWNTGSVPTSADDVFTNNFTVNVDVNATVLSLRSTASSPIVAGGSFNFNTAGVTVSATSSTPLSIGATNLIQVTATTGTVTINFGGPVAPRSFTSDVLILISGACNVNFNGTNFNGNTGLSNTTRCIVKTGSGLLTIAGIINGGSGGNGGVGNNLVLLSTNGNTVIVGNVVGGGGVGVGGNQAINQSAGTLTVTGNVIGGVGNASSQGILFTGTSISVTGTVTGGAASAAIDSTVAVNVVGSVIAGSVAAIISASNMNIGVTGNITASASSVAISSTNASASVNVTGNLQNTNGRQAVFCQQLFISDAVTTQYRFFTSGGQDRTLYSADTFPGSPAASNVRFGTTYGAGGSLTGTLLVPTPSNVLSGVPTDNTVGTYTTTPAAIATELFTKLLSGADFNTVGSFGKLLKDNVDATISSRLATSGYTTPPTPAAISTQVWIDQPVRLQNVATVDTTGAQITALS